jgi:hypothetical protein
MTFEPGTGIANIERNQEMKNTILSLVVACGLLFVGSDVYAQVDGECQAIGGPIVGASNQIAQGVNVVNNCNAILQGVIESAAAGCVVVEDTTIGIGLESGESCNNISRLCDAIFTCFATVPEFCVDVPECTIP